jgi:ferredoxin
MRRPVVRPAKGGHVRLRVDRIACDGRGLCAEVLPEWIALDDWGFPIVAPGVVPQELLGAARDAVEVCPKLALWLERAHGERAVAP